MSVVKFEIETSKEVITFNTEKELDSRVKDLRKQEVDMLVFKKLFTKSGKLKEIYLIG